MPTEGEHPIDISFDCGTCGKHLVVDEAGTGITIDCPGCGKPVYVLSPALPNQSGPPTRVEIKSTGNKGNAVPAAHSHPLVPSFSSQRKSDVHPSITGGINCLLILVAIQLVGLMLVRQNLLWSGVILVANLPFMIASLLCAVYGMCIGHVKQGILIVAGVALISVVSYWVTFSPIVHPLEEMQRQMFR